MNSDLLHILFFERMIVMSLIACTSNCIYQQDGCCRLERAASVGMLSEAQNGCVHYIMDQKNSAFLNRQE